MAKILYLEDDEQVAKETLEWLKADGHVVEHYSNGDDAWQCLQLYQYELLLLDWAVPGSTGVEVCRLYRKANGSAWVILLTGKGSLVEKEEGFDIGADDYLVKPVELREISARIRSALRRAQRAFSPGLVVDDVTLDPNTRSLDIGDKRVKLTKRESALLEFLMRNPHRVFGSRELLSSVWPADSESTEGTVRTLLYALRKKFAEVGRPNFVRTVAKEGYAVGEPNN